MFMTNVIAKLMEKYRCQIPDYSVIDLKSHYRGLKYMIETLKILPQKPIPSPFLSASVERVRPVYPALICDIKEIPE